MIPAETMMGMNHIQNTKIKDQRNDLKNFEIFTF